MQILQIGILSKQIYAENIFALYIHGLNVTILMVLRVEIEVYMTNT